MKFMKSLALTSILELTFEHLVINLRPQTHFVSRRADLSDKIELIDIFEISAALKSFKEQINNKHKYKHNPKLKWLKFLKFSKDKISKIDHLTEK